ncbi:MAG: sigma-70 family RNA polymerase sigma factor [Elusimicrobiota bacterium]
MARQPDFAAFYDAFFGRIYNYIRYRVSDPAAAEDVTSAVFEKALDKFESYRAEKGPIEAWIFAVARNTVNDHFRRRRLWAWLPWAEGSPAEGDTPETLLSRKESDAELLSALACLNERERDVLAMKFAWKMTNRGIAAQTGLSESNVGVIVFRSVKRLRGEMERKSHGRKS